MDTYPNCYTDLSSLIPAMERDPDAYRNFIIDYQDQILFGSDALIGWPEYVASALRFVTRLLEEGEVLEKLTNRNYLKFHRLSGRAQ
jgi:predicted TIM-barrel fold metal-dependent hydrolase